jgi:hypothetical protein
MLEARTQNIIEMAVQSAAMLRVFHGGELEKIVLKLGETISQLGKEGYEKLHKEFCDWFLKEIKPNVGEKPSYGQAAKVIDVAMKIIVGYCYLPRLEVAVEVASKLHPAIDSYVLIHLKDYPEAKGIETLTQIDQPLYEKLQSYLKTEAQENGCIPIRYDDCLWRVRKDKEKKKKQSKGRRSC